MSEHAQVQYATECRPQNSREEVRRGLVDPADSTDHRRPRGHGQRPSPTCASVADVPQSLLKTFYKASKKQPTKIIFYRDGVSEGQFAHVVVQEVSAIRRACLRLDASYRPKLTYVSVTARCDRPDRAASAASGTTSAWCVMLVRERR